MQPKKSQTCESGCSFYASGSRIPNNFENSISFVPNLQVGGKSPATEHLHNKLISGNISPFQVQLTCQSGLHSLVYHH